MDCWFDNLSDNGKMYHFQKAYNKRILEAMRLYNEIMKLKRKKTCGKECKYFNEGSHHCGNDDWCEHPNKCPLDDIFDGRFCRDFTPKLEEPNYEKERS